MHANGRRHSLAVWRHGEGPVAVADPALFQWQVANLANAGVDDLRMVAMVLSRQLENTKWKHPVLSVTHKFRVGA